MARPLRIQYPGAWYHVMNRGASHQKIFLNDDDKNSFLNLLGEASKMWSIQVHAFCLLDNHYHLLIHTPKENLSRSMRHVNGIYTQRYNRKYGKDGPIFRGRFKGILIDANSYLLEVVRYIDLNPVKANILNTPEEYHWGSHHYYLNKRPSISWLVRDEVLGRFADTYDHSIERYKEFVKEGIPYYVEEFYTKKNTSFILGGERFREWVITKLPSTAKEQYEMPEAKSLNSHYSADQIIDIVMKGYKVNVEILERVQRGKWNEPRDVAIYLCRKEGGLALKEIGSKFGIRAYTTVSMAYRGVKERISRDKSFRKRLNAIIEKLRS
ncbi:MAG: helix-turn-helix domain-containing protein [Thermodesulfobacteriota bacterium]